ncbi:SDR family oxidoreductase [Sphingomonas morindae]|uniref:SDR family oxidoreductase n=1 Tax=Sphingomonas morindae TaxID=1541170 RepID=A0ABY4X7K1_9SPHN|nr:SDR family oxidoreductase [Sphingomonas morindae]USI72913.1 SDR family oxidoreductase [Sphingomonas morindae]
MLKRHGQAIVITGASSGIGAATAEAFAARGARLVLAARDGDALEAVAARCRAAGGTASIVPTDITDAAACVALAEAAVTALGEIDLWFSDVGIGVVGRFTDVPMADHRRVIETNLIGRLNDAHAVLPVFLAQGHGIFVNMVSVGGLLAAPWAVAYAASKFGLRGFSQALRGELHGHPDIHICDVFPTFVDTPAIRHAGNYTGGETSVPPGVLDPRTVARAVMRLADRPRAATAVGAPLLAMKLGQLLGPNIGAAIMDRALGRYFAQAAPAASTSGNLHQPPADDGAIDGGFRDPERGRKAATLGAATLGVALVAGLALARRRGPARAAPEPAPTPAREAISDGPNARPLNETVAGTGPGIADDAGTPGREPPPAPSDAEVAEVARRIGAPVPEVLRP